MFSVQKKECILLDISRSARKHLHHPCWDFLFKLEEIATIKKKQVKKLPRPCDLFSRCPLSALLFLMNYNQKLRYIMRNTQRTTLLNLNVNHPTIHKISCPQGFCTAILEKGWLSCLRLNAKKIHMARIAQSHICEK